MLGIPAAANSETVDAPARHTTRSACANAIGMSEMNSTTSPDKPLFRNASVESLGVAATGLMHDANRNLCLGK